MKKAEFEMLLVELGFMGTFDTIKGLNQASTNFFTKVAGTIKRIVSENTFKKITSERFEKFLNMTTKEILVKNERFYLYRVSGRLYINVLIENVWNGAMVY